MTLRICIKNIPKSTTSLKTCFSCHLQTVWVPAPAARCHWPPEEKMWKPPSKELFLLYLIKPSAKWLHTQYLHPRPLFLDAFHHFWFVHKDPVNKPGLLKCINKVCFRWIYYVCSHFADGLDKYNKKSLLECSFYLMFLAICPHVRYSALQCLRCNSTVLTGPCNLGL